MSVKTQKRSSTTASWTSSATWAGGIPLRSWSRTNSRINAVCSSTGGSSSDRGAAHSGRLRSDVAMSVLTQPGQRQETPTVGTLALQLLVQALGDRDDGPLARRVGAVPGVVAGHRGGVHDVSVAVLEEVREEGAVTVDDPPHVDADDPPPVVELDRRDQPSNRPPRRCCTPRGPDRSARGQRRGAARRRRHRRHRSARRSPRRPAPSRSPPPRRAGAPRRRPGRCSSRRRRSARRRPAPSRCRRP